MTEISQRATKSRTDEASELLLREAHHRVGNHLQLLASLIAIEARSQTDGAIREALLQVRGRILAVARIHDDLRVAGRSDQIDVSSFLAQIAEDFERSFGGTPLGRLDLEFDIDDGQVSLPGETAMTLGLIVNELISNAMKHGTTGGDPRIQVRLRRDRSQLWRLCVADNGPGLPERVMDRPDDDGHGLGLVKLLARKIHGGVAVENGPTSGAKVAVYFS